MPKATSATMLGHTMSTVHSRNTNPTNIPKICIPSGESGPMGGR